MKAAGLSRSFQITNLFFELTVAENLRLAAQVLEPVAAAFLPIRRSARAPRPRSTRCSIASRCGGKAGELAGNLSHGEQRRLEIAVCLASEPKILLLDEPTQGMSHGDTENTAELVRSLVEDVTVLLIEHDIGLVMSLSDHVVVMHQGRKLAEGTPADRACRSGRAGRLFRTRLMLTVSEPSRPLRLEPRHPGHRSRGAARRGGRHLRAQRRRQDDAAQDDRRLGEAELRRDPPRRRTARWP